VATIDPMHQFRIHKVVDLSSLSVTLPGVGTIDPSITNSTMAMFGAAALIIVFFSLVTAAPKVVPGRIQSVGELLFGLVDNLASSIIGHDGRKYFPYIFTLFLTILGMNILGLFLIFTGTSQLAITATLGFMTIAIVIIVGFVKNGLGFFKLFVPGGVPLALLPVICLIEIISFLLRPVTLSLRLFGNMMGGHVALKVFASFVVALGGMAAAGGLSLLALPVAGLSLVGVVALTALEFLVAFLQAFVFTVLTCIYLNDVVNLKDNHH
jgi:F-type H+-transporting ATPase subunit a